MFFWPYYGRVIKWHARHSKSKLSFWCSTANWWERFFSHIFPGLNKKCWIVCLGDSSQWSHLFPFRTEKLSTVEPMILLVGKVGSRQDKIFNIQNLNHIKNVVVCACFETRYNVLMSLSTRFFRNIALLFSVIFSAEYGLMFLDTSFGYLISLLFPCAQDLKNSFPCWFGLDILILYASLMAALLFWAIYLFLKIRNKKKNISVS